MIFCNDLEHTEITFSCLKCFFMFFEFDCFNYECNEKNDIQLLLFLMWDIWTLSCSKNQLNSFELASNTSSQICLSHRLHNVLLTGKVMMMIEGTGLPCRVVRLAGGVRSPPGVGANEPSWATLCARCGREEGGGASVHVVVARHWQSVHTVARMCTLCRDCSLPVLASVPALESAGARGWERSALLLAASSGPTTAKISPAVQKIPPCTTQQTKTLLSFSKKGVNKGTIVITKVDL